MASPAKKPTGSARATPRRAATPPAKAPSKVVATKLAKLVKAASKVASKSTKKGAVTTSRNSSVATPGAKSVKRSASAAPTRPKAAAPKTTAARSSKASVPSGAKRAGTRTKAIPARGHPVPVSKKTAAAVTKAAAAPGGKPTVTSRAASSSPGAGGAAKASRATAPKPTKPRKPPAGKTCPLSGIFVPVQTPNVAPRTLDKLRSQLEEERERHLRQAVAYETEAVTLATEREPGDTQFDEESGEGDTISVERERDLLLSASARHAVDEIDRAVARMDAGTYGLCVPAGRRLPVARLEAIPWAEVCVDCQQRVARRR